MIKKKLLILLAALLILLLVVPFLIPVPPLENTVPPEELADPDSRFIEINGLTVHYKQAGRGDTALILLHGFAASTYTWRAVMPALAEQYRVVAFDRPAFGLTERPLPGAFPNGVNPYTAEAQADLVIGLMDALGLERAVLVGNSAGGTVAAYTALHAPDRVQALVLVDAAIYSGGGAPGFVRPLLQTPQMQHLGPLLARLIQRGGYQFGQSAWHDPAGFTDAIWSAYQKPLRAENWDRALWELTAASRPLHLDQQLTDLTMPVLVITGDDDRIVPTEQSLRLATEIPGARLAVIPACGHVPQEECPSAWLEAVRAFLNENP